MADIKVNELPTATPALTDKLFGIGASEEYQAEISGVANVVLKNYSNSSLETTSKNVVGAINELNDTTNRLEETTNEILTGANEVISEATTNWLEENVTPTGSAVAVDSSLEIAGAAADSKTVGDRFDTMEQTIEDSTATDTTLSVSGKPADAKATGDELADLKSDLNAVLGDTYDTKPLGVYTTAQGWRLNESNGLCFSDSAYKMVKYSVTEGEILKVISDDRFQFQNAASVPSSGASNRVGKTYGEGTEYVSVPTGATFLIVSTTVENSQAEVFTLSSAVSKASEFLKLEETTFVNGKYYNLVSHEIASSNDYSYAKINVSLFGGGTIKGATSVVPNTSDKGIAFVDASDNFIIGYVNPTDRTYLFNYELTIPSNAAYMYIPLRNVSADQWSNPEYPWDVAFRNIQNLSTSLDDFSNQLIITNKKLEETDIPLLRNGSIGNAYNNNAVASQNVIKIMHDYDYLILRFVGYVDGANSYAFAYCLFSGASDGMSTTEAFSDSSISKENHNQNATDTTPYPYIIIPVSDLANYDYMSVALWTMIDGTITPIRIDSNQYSIKLEYGLYMNDSKDIGDEKIALFNARHVAQNAIAPLTILHFSDLHADSSALNRIMSEAKEVSASIDEYICTGDIVSNSAVQIASWWNPSVLTCIGNHDTASYDSTNGYNWTALSMADRDAYYIAPFESNWDIVHTSGTSYYYKDYAAQKIRMIVMDSMLYVDNGTEATTQTAWLANLLSDAITNDYHVLIAIHSPHGGAVAVDCSFSRYKQSVMPTYNDCNTPQVVIDTVATAIGNGLHFIGYIVGHTHQDNIWDAENDGTQLMYCITCGIVSNENQWKNGDQYRGTDADAYNLVTIDTANTLVKIVRGGGANIDDHMRTRKAICFNYSTGEMVGEVL